MRKGLRLATGLVLSVATLAGCSDWLTGNKLTNNPNFPTTAAPNQLMTAIETNLTFILTGDLARTLAVWMQQMGGSDRQYISIADYQVDEDAFAPDWAGIYTGGGLVDIRTLQQQSLAKGDSITAGIGYVFEAMDMGTAADLWGDVPYSQAVDTVTTPMPDPQQQVYATVQAKLDTALVLLTCTNAAVCTGPGGNDVWANGDPAEWTMIAHTLKARYYLHVAARIPQAYDSAFVQTDSGIAAPTNDLLTWQSLNPNEWNLWYQFMVIQRSGYISAGGFLVDTLRNSHDPRLTQYFSPNSSGEFVGVPAAATSGDYSQLSATRGAPDFRQPLVTFAENELIRAEAALKKSTPDQAAANAAYNAERTSQGVSTLGSVTLANIIAEKYIALFQNGIEVWNDWKRTCLPALTPASPPGIPERLLYPLSTERNANPNIPPPDQQPERNWNQPNSCHT